MTQFRSLALWGAVVAGMAGIAGCSSPADAPQNNYVSMTINDTTANAGNILYLNIGNMNGGGTYISFSAARGGDTLEVVGLIQQGATYTFANPSCVLRLRRAWGIYQDSSNAPHALLDSLHCSTYSPNLIEGVITTASPIAHVSGPKDSLKFSCSFSLGY